MSSEASAYIGCMLAQEFEHKRIKYPVAVEDKLDGFRVTHVAGQGYTRNGKTYESFRPFAEILHRVVGHDAIHVDTEMMAQNWNETSKLLKRVKDVDAERIKREVVTWVFDVYHSMSIGEDEYSRRREMAELIARRAADLAPGYTFKATPMVIARNEDELTAAYEAALERGREGIMVKPLDGVYVLKRSFSWLKLKPEEDMTVVVKDWEPQHGLCPGCMTVDYREERAAKLGVERDDVKADPNCPQCEGTGEELRPNVLGALHCETLDGQKVRVGGGFTADQRIEFVRRFHELKGMKLDIKVQQDKHSDIVARHPRFLRFREDL